MTSSLDAALPSWLQPLADLVSSVDAEQLAPRFPNPPDDARPAAVLMLFAEGDDGPDLLLTERATTLRAHAGQLAFPGGSVDPDDEDVVATALRESQEEVGLRPDEVVVFGQLPMLWIPVNNFGVTTVLGYWPHPRPLEPVDPAEVASVFRVPIASLLDPAQRFTVLHSNGWRGPAFEVGTSVPLWGFTAGLVSRLFDAAGWTTPWDESVTRPVPGLS